MRATACSGCRARPERCRPRRICGRDAPGLDDQGQIGSCTANAIAAAIEFDQRKQQLPQPFTPSRLFIYYNERLMEGSVASDSGAQIRDGIKSVAFEGACAENCSKCFLLGYALYFRQKNNLILTWGYPRPSTRITRMQSTSASTIFPRRSKVIVASCFDLPRKSVKKLLGAAHALFLLRPRRIFQTEASPALALPVARSS